MVPSLLDQPFAKHRLPLHLSENENAELLAQLKLSQRLSEEAAGSKMSKVVNQHTELEHTPSNLYWLVVSNYFSCSPLFGEDSHFD